MFGRCLLTEAVHFLFGKATFDERTCVGARGGMALEEDMVATARVILTAEEVVEANLVER